MEVDALVKAELTKVGASPETVELWQRLLRAYDEGGSRNVKELLQERVQESQKRAKKEAKNVGKVVSAAAKPKRRARR
jgi:hypothetical protein